jgi:signal transduction histidine kinase
MVPPTRSAPPPPTRDDREVRRLSRVHLVALGAVALLLVAAEVLTQASLQHLEDDGRELVVVTNAQTEAHDVARSALELRNAADDEGRTLAREALSARQAELERMHKQVAGGSILAADSERTEELDQSWQALAAAARSLLTRPPPTGEAATALIDELLQEQRTYLAALSAATVELEGDNRARVRRLKRVELAVLLGLLIVVVAEGLLVLRPAVASVRRSLASARSTEELLRESEEGKRAILAAIPDQLLRIARHETFLELQTGRPDPIPGGLSPREWPRLAQVVGPYVNQALLDGQPQEVGFQVPGSGAARHMQVRLVPSAEDEVLAIVQDVTERRYLEQRLLDAGAQERERLGQDIHDGLCQHLAGTGLVMRTLLTRLRKSEELSREDLEMAARLVDEATLEARALARGLVPVTVERLGLAGALLQVAEDLSRVHGVPVAAQVDLAGIEPEEHVGIQLFRIAQEAATNAAKHAQATSIGLRLALEEDDLLVLEVSDDGVGIEEERRRPDSMGLRIMDYRARLIGAFLQIDAGEQGGTTVSCRLALVPDDGERSGFYGLAGH